MRHKQLEKCLCCGNEFYCEYVEQIPGFRDVEEKTCPYCKTVLRTSMEYEFITYEK